MKHVGITCCSDGRRQENAPEITKLQNTLRELQIETVMSPYIFRSDSVMSATGRHRAKALIDFYRNPEIDAIFDISGGDIANQVLSHLDFEVIRENPKEFWGYSDLTTILNAIYTATGQTGVLYSVRNLVTDGGAVRSNDFRQSFLQDKTDLFELNTRFLQGKRLEGIAIGGNIRCFLKLAGTAHFPDLSGKMLVLEAFGGLEAQMITYLSQLEQLGAFSKVAGILLGTFTKMDEVYGPSKIEELVLDFTGPGIPVARTMQVGHAADAKAVRIGGLYSLSEGG